MALNVLQLNVCGLRNKVLEVTKLMLEQNVDVALIQEARLGKQPCPNIGGFSRYVCSCRRCSGLVTFVRNNLTAQFIPVDSNGKTDVLSTMVWKSGKRFVVHNVYNSPNQKLNIPLDCDPTENTIFAGDFNARSVEMGYSIGAVNDAGRTVEELLLSTNLVRLQNGESAPTLLHNSLGTESRPDITLISANLLQSAEFQVLKDVRSDHLPVLTSFAIGRGKKAKYKKGVWNLRKSEWAKYAAETDRLTSEIDISEGDVNSANEALTSCILEAANSTCQRNSDWKYRQFWDAQIECKIQERRKARKIAARTRKAADRVRYNRLTAEVKVLSKRARTRKWHDTCQGINLVTHGRKAWKLLHSLNGEGRTRNPAPIKHDGFTADTDRKRAKLLNRFIASTNSVPKRQQSDRALKREKGKGKGGSCQWRPSLHSQ